MNRFEQTSIWQKTLGKQLEPDIHEKERDFLRVEFESFRERAKLLAAEIASVLPGFTVHDITHIDALWETAELVMQNDFEITPAEAFVLGGTFLIHDLGMGLASFPFGVEELKKEAIWKDTIASLLKEKLNRPIKETDYLNLDNETEKIATENVLRLLHAKHAEKLALISWKNKDNKDIYLIENTELRESYGSIIGLIAHSHWWTIDELVIKLPRTLGAPGIFPQNWTVDAVKLACILRIADATQIDDRRAPSFLRTIRKPSNYSDMHWNFQQKLYQPRLERNRLVYTSKSPFKIDEVESWWICNDTLQMIDNELKDVDSLLVDTNRQRLKAIGIASIEDPKRLSKLIAVEGWQPIDTKIKVTNVAKLVGSLGGKQLYGDNSIVPLRELIQNASDAIRARRILENEKPEFGNIIVRFGKDEYGQFIEVEDNGIGMSPKVLTGPFLDFGESFWGTSLMHEELPGLESKGFSSTGKYGIGFFSVFMWGEKVSVSSKRFENGRDSTLVLEFNKGASSRPILRKAGDTEVMKDGGTRIRVWLSNSRILDKLLERYDRRQNRITISELIESLCPSIDCNIILEEKSRSKKIIEANDWMTLPPLFFLKRIIGESYYNELGKSEKQLLTKLSKNLTLLKDNDTIVGRLALYKTEDKIEERFSFEGKVTVGGMSSSGLTNLLGILVGKSDRASRDIGVPIATSTTIKDWATNQADLLFKMKLNGNTQIECASVIRSLEGNTSKLKIANHKNGFINYQETKTLISETNYDEYLVVQDAAISNYERDNNCKISYYDNVIWVDTGIPGILQTRNSDHWIDWPEINTTDRFQSRSLEGLITEAFSKVWGKKISSILKISDESSDKKSYEGSVGTVDGKEAIIDHLDIIRKVKK
ncbi:HD domain-containing protein [Chryseobacterium indoltheticum]|uniref:HD domain-containing protein n=1 Tax=Chryseobacterium indoltheticum TaxID=254 RepID=UPI0040411107